MLTTESGCDYTGGRAENSKSSGISAPIDFAGFFISALKSRECEEYPNNSARLLSCFQLPTPYGLRKSSEKGKVDMTNQVVTFNFNNNQVRTTLINGEVYFCLSDLRSALTIKGSLKVGTLNPKGIAKDYALTEGGKQKLTFVNEPNVYRLAFRSHKPEAEKFANWVYEEVLPTIRKTGGYGQELQRNPEFMKALGGLVKNCCRVAVREELAAMGDLSPEQMKALIANTSLMIELTAQARTKQLWQEKEQKIKQIIG